MKTEDYQKFAELMAGICDAYEKQSSEAMLNFYWSSFKPYTVHDFEKAIQMHGMDTGEGMFFPKPAHLIKQLEGTQKDKQQAVNDRAEIAWADIQGQVRSKGSYGNLELDDKQAIAAVKGLGGWKEICRTETDRMTWLKKEFFKLYDTYENTPLEMLPNSLPGRLELENHKKGLGSNSGQGITMQQIIEHRKKMID